MSTGASKRQPRQRMFGRFVLTRLLGQGGMGEVWLARDEQLEQDVALKFLSGAMLHDANAVERLKRETRHSLKLTHPHIVRIYDFVQDEHDAAISMEYVEGWSLWAMKVDRPDQRFTVEEITPWVRQLCAALEYAHTVVDVVHRDLKPANLIIDARAQLKITDFGIARNLTGVVGQYTAALPALGTIGYMSPQQAMGSEPSVSDDIYSLGATLYELLTGQPPFYKGEVLVQMQQLAPPSMTERLHELGVQDAAPLPYSWEQTVAACLEKNPARRPSTVAIVLRDLFIERETPVPPALPARELMSAGSRRILAGALITAALCALIIVALILFKEPLKKRWAAGISPASPGNIVATRIFIGADDFVVDVFHNGQRVPLSARRMTTERFGAIGERTDITVRENDWVVFNVVNNRLRWNGDHYFGAAGVRDDGTIGFSSEESPLWSVCADPGLVPRFIAEPEFLAKNLARRIEKPWGGGDGMIKAHVRDWAGYAIWGDPTNRNLWIKFRAKPTR